MNEYLRQEQVRQALDDCLSGALSMPSQRAAILRRAAKEERKPARGKLRMAMAAALILTLLAVGAVAAVWLSMREVVEQTVLPMALENDTADTVDTFTPQELEKIAATAAENGVMLPEKILSKIESGEGYWEEETIMALAKAEYGPIPGRWTLEQQYWFEEMAVAIGFKEYNAARIPAEDDLTYEQAAALAADEMQARYGADRERLLGGEAYWITRGYNAYRNENGQIQEPVWYFWFEPVSLADDEYIVTMDQAGKIIEVKASLDRGKDYDAVHDHYSDVYGQEKSWTQDVWIAFGRDMQGVQSDMRIAKCFQQTQYIEIPQGALSRADAIERARSAKEYGDILESGAVCMLSGDERNLPVWKVRLLVDTEDGRETVMAEIDCMSGDVLGVYLMEEGDGWSRPFVSEAVYQRLRRERHPEGLG